MVINENRRDAWRTQSDTTYVIGVGFHHLINGGSEHRPLS
jgi:hypothetical protein